MLGAVFMLLAAATFALNNAFTRRGVLTGTAGHAVLITVSMGCLPFLAITAITGELWLIGDLSWTAIALLAGAGIIHFIGGRYFNFLSMKAMGANLSGPVQSAHLFVSLTLAVAFLGETVDIVKIVGILLIVLGAALALRRPRKARHAGAAAAGEAIAPARPAFQPRILEGTIYALTVALIWGISPIMIRLAMTEMKVGLLGGFISYIAATAVLVVWALATSQVAKVLVMDRSAMRDFTVAGGIVSVSQMFRYLALSIGPVVVVEPLMRTSLVFRVFFAWLINREHESFHTLLLVGVGCSIAGAVLLTIGTALVVSWLPLPADVAAALSAWHWPN